jgi:hypothetical protein
LTPAQFKTMIKKWVIKTAFCLQPKSSI